MMGSSQEIERSCSMTETLSIRKKVGAALLAAILAFTTLGTAMSLPQQALTTLRPRARHR